MSKAKTLGQVEKPKNGDLRVWWIPQLSRDTPLPQFQVPVASLVEAALLLETLAKYDLFQFENNVKPDYCNTGGLEVWCEAVNPDDDGSRWITWLDEDGDELEYRTLDEIRRNMPIWEMDEVLKPH